jgi:hypothetical protein
MDYWDNKIEEYRKVTSNKVFIDVRKEAEDKAKKLIIDKIGLFNKSDLKNLIELLNLEQTPKSILENKFRDNPTYTRFDRSFNGMNKNLIINSIENFNLWLSYLWESKSIEEDVIKSLRSRKVLGAGFGLPSMITYIKNPNKYFYYIEPLGLALVKFLRIDDLNKYDYSRYNSLININLKERYKLLPQEIDYILFRISKETTT